MKSGSNKTQWGVAGLGNVASKFFAPALSHSSRSELVACVDVNPESARSKHEAESRQMEAIRNGTVDRGWVDKLLMEKGCEFVG